jgi:hypothetical protein
VVLYIVFEIMVSSFVNWLDDVCTVRTLLAFLVLSQVVPYLRAFVHLLIQISGALAGNEVLKEMAPEVKKIAKANQAMAKTLREVVKELEAMRKAFEVQRHTFIPRTRKFRKPKQVRSPKQKVAVAQVNALISETLKTTEKPEIPASNPPAEIKEIPRIITPDKPAEISQSKLRRSGIIKNDEMEIGRLPKVGEVILVGLKDITEKTLQIPYPEQVLAVRKKTILLRHTLFNTERVISKDLVGDIIILLQLPQMYNEYFKAAFFDGDSAKLEAWRAQLWKS